MSELAGIRVFEVAWHIACGSLGCGDAVAGWSHDEHVLRRQAAPWCEASRGLLRACICTAARAFSMVQSCMNEAAEVILMKACFCVSIKK